jgi:hypothetical protein
MYFVERRTVVLMIGVAFHLRVALDHLVYEDMITLTDTNVFVRIALLVNDFMENDGWDIEIPVKRVNQVNLLRSWPDKSYPGTSASGQRESAEAKTSSSEGRRGTEYIPLWYSGSRSISPQCSIANARRFSKLS